MQADSHKDGSGLMQENMQAEMKSTSLKELLLCTWETWKENEQINK